MNSRRDPEAIMKDMGAKKENVPPVQPFFPNVPTGSIHTPKVNSEIEVKVEQEVETKKSVEKTSTKDVVSRNSEGKFQFHKKITTDIRDSKEFKRANIGLPKQVKMELDMLCTESELSWVEYSNIMCAYIVERGGIPEEFIKRYKKGTQD